MFPKRPRLPNFDYLGRHHYFLTFCTRDRAVVFVNDDVFTLALTNFLRAGAERGFALPAYVFMTDHVHLLVHGLTDSSDLRGYASLAKQYSAFAYAKAGKGRLWQPSYYDHVIRPEEGIAGFIAYIVANPVRAGLVSMPEDYPHLGSVTMDRGEMIQSVRDVAPVALHALPQRQP